MAGPWIGSAPSPSRWRPASSFSPGVQHQCKWHDVWVLLRHSGDLGGWKRISGSVTDISSAPKSPFRKGRPQRWDPGPGDRSGGTGQQGWRDPTGPGHSQKGIDVVRQPLDPVAGSPSPRPGAALPAPSGPAETSEVSWGRCPVPPSRPHSRRMFGALGHLPIGLELSWHTT